MNTLPWKDPARAEALQAALARRILGESANLPVPA